MNELALFAGAGGGILGGHLLGWRTVCAVEWADYPRRVLLARQRDGILPRFPTWDDVQTFDGNPWRGRVDVVSGGFPCQDISAAGKGAGIDGARSGMWFHMARIIGEVRPRFAFVENSPILTSRGLGRVLGDLASMGYNAEWCVLGANDIGAPHKRDRIWILGSTSDSTGINCYTWRTKPERQLGASWPADGSDDVAESIEQRGERRGKCRVCVGGDQWGEAKERSNPISETTRRSPCVSDAYSQRREEQFLAAIADQQGQPNWGCDAQLANPASREPRIAAKWEGRENTCGGSEKERGKYDPWWSTEPRLGRVAHGVARRVDRLAAIGNGQVPAVAATAFRILTERAGWTI